MISHAEHFAWLLRVGTGWLGWTEEQTLGTRMSSIIAAYRGRCDMLKAIFGGGSDGASGSSPTVAERPLTPALFDALFG